MFKIKDLSTGVRRGSTLAAAVLAIIFGAASAYPADFSSYRGFHLGASVAASVKQAGADASAVRRIHDRPAVLEELDWRPLLSYRADSKRTSPVRDAKLRFYNGQLFQLIVTYEQDQIEGLTESDIVEVISRTHGTASKPVEEIPFQPNYSGVAEVLARWENADYSYDLVRTGDRSSFALVLSSKRLNTLAREAIVEANRLDALEAPQREAESRQKVAESTRQGLAKARALNLPKFVP